MKIGRTELPVKLYSAVQERTVRFRLLHKTDLQPVKQQLVSSDSGEELDYGDVRKAFPLGRGRAVVLEERELESIEPQPSRDGGEVVDLLAVLRRRLAGGTAVRRKPARRSSAPRTRASSKERGSAPRSKRAAGKRKSTSKKRAVSGR